MADKGESRFEESGVYRVWGVLFKKNTNLINLKLDMGPWNGQK